MSLETYRLIHIVGLMLVFLGLGNVLLRSRGADGSPRFGLILHGIGLLLMLVAGFGMLARLGISWPWPGWLWGKLVCWLLLGALPVLHKRDILPTMIAWIIAAAVGGAAAYLVFFKPF